MSIRPSRVFVLGNGPSQAKINLDDLKGETVFACNRIHLRYHETEWRPTHYVMVEDSNNPDWKDDILFHAEQDYEKYISEYMILNILPTKDGVWNYEDYDIKIFPHPCSMSHSTTVSPYEWHDDLCSYGGAVFVSIQIAVKYIETPEIVLLGCDNHYEPESENHMVEGYLPIEKWTPERVKLRNWTLARAMRIAQRECDARGVNLLSATRVEK